MVQAKATGNRRTHEKMAEGRLRKEFFLQVVLMQQASSRRKATGRAGGEGCAGRSVLVSVPPHGFVRYALGEAS